MLADLRDGTGAHGRQFAVIHPEIKGLWESKSLMDVPEVQCYVHRL